MPTYDFTSIERIFRIVSNDEKSNIIYIRLKKGCYPHFFRKGLVKPEIYIFYN